ncbi:MAG: carbamoyl-phosphate synthase small subunit, partial [Bdellovibrionales bacterium]|nr:carbamoyl-phosphate synthase small subunit [Bdellovibrionales bacterium]
AVDEKSFGSGVKISHVNLYDGTVEGIECLDKKCMSVQFHPESHPGPREAAALFDVFTGRLK